jgi:hypothetical protein
LTSLEAAYGDLKEEIGKVVTDSAAVRQGIEALTIAVQDLTSWFSSPEGKQAAKLFFAEIAGGAGDAINAILGAKRALQDLSGQGDRSSFLSRAGGAADVFFQSIDIPAYLIANATGRMKEAQAQYDDAWRRMMGIGGPRPEESPLMQTLEQLANRLQNVAVQARKTSNQITLPDILIPIPDDGPRKPINETQGGVTRRSEPMGPPRELFEAYEKEQEAIDKLFAEADAAKAQANERAIEREREAAQKIADARAEVEQRAMEAERARIAEYAGFWRAALSQVTDLFGNAWGTIGKLQTKTTTEIVRNEKGMLEERTVMTEQYIGTVGTALGQFLGDAASMFAKAALNFIATKAVEAAAGMITSAISTLGFAGLLIAPAAAAVAMGLVAATKSQVPPPPKFFTGGRVPGPLGAPRVAVVEGGERVVSVADSIDQRGSRGGSVVVQQQLLVAPSRVSMERANRDSILPALRRMQRLGMAT